MTWQDLIDWTALVIAVLIGASLLVFLVLMWSAWRERPPRHHEERATPGLATTLKYKFNNRKPGKGGGR